MKYENISLQIKSYSPSILIDIKEPTKLNMFVSLSVQNIFGKEL